MIVLRFHNEDVALDGLDARVQAVASRSRQDVTRSVGTELPHTVDDPPAQGLIRLAFLVGDPIPSVFIRLRPVEHSPQRLVEIEHAVVCDAGADLRLEGSGSWSQIPADAMPQQRDPLGIDLVCVML